MPTAAESAERIRNVDMTIKDRRLAAVCFEALRPSIEPAPMNAATDPIIQHARCNALFLAVLGREWTDCFTYDPRFSTVSSVDHKAAIAWFEESRFRLDRVMVCDDAGQTVEYVDRVYRERKDFPGTEVEWLNHRRTRTAIQDDDE